MVEGWQSLVWWACDDVGVVKGGSMMEEQQADYVANEGRCNGFTRECLCNISERVMMC